MRHSNATGLPFGESGRECLLHLRGLYSRKESIFNVNERRKSIFNVNAHSDMVTQKSAPTSNRGDLKRSTGSPGALHEKIILATNLATVGEQKESAVVGDLVTLAKATPKVRSIRVKPIPKDCMSAE